VSDAHLAMLQNIVNKELGMQPDESLSLVDVTLEI